MQSSGGVKVVVRAPRLVVGRVDRAARAGLVVMVASAAVFVAALSMLTVCKMFRRDFGHCLVALMVAGTNWQCGVGDRMSK